MTLRTSDLSAELVQACSHLPARSPRSNTTTPHTLILLDKNKGRGKVKFTLEQATEAQRGSRGIALLFFNLGARWRSVFNATPRPLYPRERDPAPIV